MRSSSTDCLQAGQFLIRVAVLEFFATFLAFGCAVSHDCSYPCTGKCPSLCSCQCLPSQPMWPSPGFCCCIGDLPTKALACFRLQAMPFPQGPVLLACATSCHPGILRHSTLPLSSPPLFLFFFFFWGKQQRSGTFPLSPCYFLRQLPQLASWMSRLFLALGNRTSFSLQFQSFSTASRAKQSQ